MKILFVFLVVSCALAEFEDWQLYKLNYGKTYKTLMEDNRRFAIFQSNIQDINEHNRKFALGETTWTKAINHFTDMTREEFVRTLTLTPKHYATKKNKNNWHKRLGFSGSDVNVDYVQEGLVTPVKKQGQCGACWAFSAVGALEAQLAKHRGSLMALSAQDLVDCSRKYGCGGGIMDEAFQWVAKYGIAIEKEYPFTSQNGTEGICKHVGSVKFTGYRDIAYGDEEALLDALVNVGPISVTMDATELHSYGGGILDTTCGCDKDERNHGVLLVGAGTENDVPYYLVKNSWGTEWGHNGYFKLRRNENACGLANEASYPFI